MLNKELSEYVIFDAQKQVVRADQEARVKAILNRDYDEFLRTREYAIENMHYLKGKRIPLEVYEITNLPNHNCIIVDDLILLSYTEVAEIIMRMKEKEKKNGTAETVESNIAGHTVPS